jgi:hypothetical protein
MGKVTSRGSAQVEWWYVQTTKPSAVGVDAGIRRGRGSRDIS